MTIKNKDTINKLIVALTNKGYNKVDATNKVNLASGDDFENLVREYLSVDKLTAFVRKFDGQPIDFDGKYGYQCVDLMRKYIREVIGVDPYIAVPPYSYAYQIFDNFVSNKYFTKVINDPKDPNQIPPRGAIVFWKRLVIGVTGLGGHVAVNYLPNTITPTTFDQNWPTGTLCHVQKHSWRGISGWLVPTNAQ